LLICSDPAATAAAQAAAVVVAAARVLAVPVVAALAVAQLAVAATRGWMASRFATCASRSATCVATARPARPSPRWLPLLRRPRLLFASRRGRREDPRRRGFSSPGPSH